MFHIFQGVGGNDLNGQHITYKILAIVSLCCMEQHGSAKKCQNTLRDAYPLVNLNDKNGLEHLAWTVYNGIFIPGNPPMLTGHQDWSCIIAGMTLCLIYRGKTEGALPSMHSGILQC